MLTCLHMLALDRCLEFSEPDTDGLLSGLHTITNEYWLKRIQSSDANEIIEVMRPLRPWARKYLTKLNNYELEMKYSEFLKIKHIVTKCAPQNSDKNL